MEKYNNVMKRILELTETMEEGLIHIRNQVNDGYFDASIPLFKIQSLRFLQLKKVSLHLKETILRKN